MTDRDPVLVGVDLSDESVAALTEAIALAQQNGRPVVVVHAVGLLEEAGYRDPPPLDEIVAAARRDVDGGDDVQVRVVREDGSPVDVLLRVAAREHAGLLVVGRRGQGESPRVLGSVSEGVLTRAPCPIVVVPGPRTR